jgi:hypothetical protein
MTRVPSPAGLAEASALAMLASAVAGAVGVVFIVLMYAAFAVGAQPPGLLFGWINDIAVLLQYLLAVPGVLAIGAALRIGSPRHRVGWHRGVIALGPIPQASARRAGSDVSARGVIDG